ncbi:MAG: hypothetical protein AB7Q97_15670 [Gammaproteobacteria bacterium]
MDAERRLALAASGLFALNLTFVPGLAFLALAWLWMTRRARAGPVARQHLDQAMRASLFAGALLGSTAVIVLVAGVRNPWSWVAAILYFTCVHSTLVLLGILAVVRANAGQPWRFPIIGGRESDRGNRARG